MGVSYTRKNTVLFSNGYYYNLMNEEKSHSPANQEGPNLYDFHKPGA